MTVVHNTPVDSAGGLLTGTAVTIALVTAADTSPGYTATQSIVAPKIVYTDSTTGQWTADLIPNASITPAGTYYQVTEPNGEISTIVVPATGGPYNLSSILVGSPATPGPQYIAVSQKGAANGVAILDGTGNVPLSELGNVPGGQTPSDTVVAETSYGQATIAGAAVAYSRGDHSHGTTALPTPGAIGAAPTSRQVIAGTGLSGGGDLSADRTFNVTYGTSASTAAQGNDARITGAVQASTVDAKGDLIVATADNTVARLAVGTDGYRPTADPSAATGISWQPPSPDAFTGGACTFDRRLATSTFAAVSGRVMLAYFTALRAETIGNVASVTGGTAAGATPTLCRMGVYSVAGNGDLTLVGACASDTSLFAAGNTRYQRALAATYNAVLGQRYAFGLIVVTAAALPTFQCNATMGGTGISSTTAPRIQAQLNSQSDLPSTIAVGSLANAGSGVYGEIVP